MSSCSVAYSARLIQWFRSQDFSPDDSVPILVACISTANPGGDRTAIRKNSLQDVTRGLQAASSILCSKLLKTCGEAWGSMVQAGPEEFATTVLLRLVRPVPD